MAPRRACAPISRIGRLTTSLSTFTRWKTKDGGKKFRRNVRARDCLRARHTRLAVKKNRSIATSIAAPHRTNATGSRPATMGQKSATHLALRRWASYAAAARRDTVSR